MSEEKWWPNKPNAALGLSLIPESLNVEEPFLPYAHYKDITVSCHPSPLRRLIGGQNKLFPFMA